MIALRFVAALGLVAVSLLASVALAGDSSVIGIGDRIVTLDAAQTLSDVVSATVGPFGTIAIPPIGTVIAAGLTVDQLDQLLRRHGRTVGVVIRHADSTRQLIETFGPGAGSSRRMLRPPPFAPIRQDPGLGCPTCT